MCETTISGAMFCGSFECMLYVSVFTLAHSELVQGFNRTDYVVVLMDNGYIQEISWSWMYCSEKLSFLQGYRVSLLPQPADECGLCYLCRFSSVPLGRAVTDPLCKLYSHGTVLYTCAPCGTQSRRECRSNTSPSVAYLPDTWTVSSYCLSYQVTT